MKFNPTWQQLVLLGILFAAVITAHLVAPPAVGIVTSMVSTLIGYLCGSPLQPPMLPTTAPAKEVGTNGGDA